jgi:hypothetical protein
MPHYELTVPMLLRRRFSLSGDTLEEVIDLINSQGIDIEADPHVDEVTSPLPECFWTLRSRAIEDSAQEAQLLLSQAATQLNKMGIRSDLVEQLEQWERRYIQAVSSQLGFSAEEEDDYE